VLQSELLLQELQELQYLLPEEAQHTAEAEAEELQAVPAVPDRLHQYKDQYT
jgi:hypothetical protein